MLGQFVPVTDTLNTGSIAALDLSSLSGDDVFNISGPLPYTSVIVDAGDPSASDILNLSGATGPVSVNLADSTIATNTTVTGYGGTVTLVGVEIANLNATNNTVAVVGTSQNDNITYTPSGAAAGTFTNTGLNTVFNVTNATGNLTVFGGSGGNADSVTIQGTDARDLFEINQGSAVAQVLANNVTALLPVQLGTNVEILNANGLGGQNTFQIIPTPGLAGQLQDNLLINLDGGTTGAFNALVLGSSFGNTPGTLAANQFVVVNKSLVPNSGTVRGLHRRGRRPGHQLQKHSGCFAAGRFNGRTPQSPPAWPGYFRSQRNSVQRLLPWLGRNHQRTKRVDLPNQYRIPRRSG